MVASVENNSEARTLILGSRDESSGGGALSVYKKINDPMAFAAEMGKQFSFAGVCGVQNQSQGTVLAFACMCKGIDPFELDEDYHLMNGRLSMRADSILAKFNDAGGLHRIVERSSERAAIELTWKGSATAFEFTWEEARQEPYVYEGSDKVNLPKIAAGKFGELTLAAKYATPRSRMQMLWARVISDGVRAVAPSVVKGKYTPEEIEHMEPRGKVTEEPPTPKAKQRVTAAAAIAAATSTQTGTAEAKQVDPTVIDAEFQVTPTSAMAEQPQVTEQPPFDTASQPTVETPAHTKQATIMEIQLLLEQLGSNPAAVIASLNKKNGTSITDLGELTEEQATALLANLRKLSEAKKQS